MSVSALDAIRSIQNETAYQAARDRMKEVEDSSKAEGVDRSVGGMMGKEDFLMLLSAQLRYQDPLNPQNDSQFAAQLAQFSSLEQMQNMNSTLNTLSSYQAYSLVGKFVVAEALIEGVFGEIPGVVDSIFVDGGVTYAQIGEYVVPVSSIKEVFDTNNILTTEMFMQTSNNLIGRTIIAQVDGKDIEGVVTRILVDKGSLLAQIDDGTNDPKFVPVNSIVDIRETGSLKHEPKPETPPEAVNFKTDGNGGFIELSEDGTEEIGRWDFNEDKWKWVYTSFLNDNEENENTVGETENAAEGEASGQTETEGE
ncbi:MAG: hypothetical protein FWH17_01185 [Oscillospiraceae bacterium]|nr:hypothetical protein [Oscillospiraceae bacterium]